MLNCIEVKSKLVWMLNKPPSGLEYQVNAFGLAFKDLALRPPINELDGVNSSDVVPSVITISQFTMSGGLQQVESGRNPMKPSVVIVPVTVSAPTVWSSR